MSAPALPPGFEAVETHRCFGGTQYVLAHDSAATQCRMQFGLFLPPQAGKRPVPLLVFLSGLTCTEQNFITKAGAQALAAELGLAILAPDTSPRGVDVPGQDDSYDIGSGAGFYVDATQAPWSGHYRMETYIGELLDLVLAGFPLDADNVGISGHSMGGHGALVLALRHPSRFKSLSAFAPIASSTRCPWGEKAFGLYLGSDRADWEAHDASLLLAGRGWKGDILIDQGLDDPFLSDQLKPDLLEQAADEAGVALTLRRQPGYDHSYYFIASFMADHLRWHAERLATPRQQP